MPDNFENFWAARLKEMKSSHGAQDIGTRIGGIESRLRNDPNSWNDTADALEVLIAAMNITMQHTNQQIAKPLFVSAEKTFASGRPAERYQKGYFFTGSFLHHERVAKRRAAEEYSVWNYISWWANLLHPHFVSEEMLGFYSQRRTMPGDYEKKQFRLQTIYDQARTMLSEAEADGVMALLIGIGVRTEAGRHLAPAFLKIAKQLIRPNLSTMFREPEQLIAKRIVDMSFYLGYQQNSTRLLEERAEKMYPSHGDMALLALGNALYLQREALPGGIHVKDSLHQIAGPVLQRDIPAAVEACLSLASTYPGIFIPWAERRLNESSSSRGLSQA